MTTRNRELETGASSISPKVWACDHCGAEGSEEGLQLSHTCRATMTTDTEKSPREIAENIARLSLPFSAFRNESEWKDVTTFVTNIVDKALRDRDERAAKIAGRARAG